MPISPEEFEASINPDTVQQDFEQGFADSLGTPQVRGTTASKLYAGQAAVVRGAPDNGELIAVDALQPDSKAARQQAVQEYYTEKQKELTQWVEGSIQSAPQDIEQTLTTASDIQQTLLADQTGVMSDELAYVDRAAPQGDFDLKQRQSFLIAASNDLNDAIDSQGWMENAFDFAGYLVPFGEALDIQDIDEAIKERPELAQVAGANLEEVVLNWQSLPVERQKALFPVLKEAMIDATKTSLFGLESDGNLLKATDFLTRILDPEGAEQLREQQALDVGLGVLDIAPLGVLTDIGKLSKLERASANTVLKGTADNLRNQTSAINIAAKSGDIDSAATHTVTAMSDDVVAESMNTSRVSAAMNAMPIETSQWFREVVEDDSLPSAVARKLNEAAYKAQGFTRSLTDESDLMQLGALNGSDREGVIQNFFERMEKVGEDYLTDGLEMSNLKITKRSNKGFSYSYELSQVGDPAPGALRSGEITFSINDVTGTYSATINDKVAQQASKILSPSAFSKTGKTGDFHAEVERSIQTSDLATAVQARTADMLRWATEPVSGVAGTKARGRIEDVLEAGDEYINEATQVTGRTFTPTELAAGIETRKGTVRLTSPAEQESYYRMRLYSDAAYMTENYVLRRELELGGFQQVKMFSQSVPSEVGNNVRNAAISVGKPFNERGAAKASIRDKQGWGVWDDAAQEVRDITDSYIDDVYDSGDVIVRLRKDWNTKGTGDLDASGEMVSYVRVKPSRVSDLPEQVLHYKPGYVPKINLANFVVSQVMPVIKRGVQGVRRTQATRAFDSLADAQRFREEAIVKFMNKHNVTREAAEEVFPEVGQLQDLTVAERLEEALGSHGGLFHGTRSKDEMLFGLSGQRLERASPYEAFQRQVAHMGTFVARNEVRVGAERRWLNTVRREFPEVEVRGFDNTAIPANTPRGKLLEQLRQQIKEWNGIPTRDENMFQAAVQSVHDWSLNGARKLPFGMRDKESVKSLQWLKHSNPITAIKTAVMHNLLGMLNPAQYYTQASAALVAVSKNPAAAARTLPRAITFHTLDNIRNDKALGKVYKMLVGSGDFSSDLTNAHTAWRRTGLYESVFNNADTAKIAADGLGVTMGVMRKAENASLFFYRAGELFNRRWSFLIEYDTWAKRTGKTIPDDDELSQIVAETNKNMLELNAANRAYWQGGYGTGPLRQITGMATQFMQVTAKTLELAFKGEGRGGFTPAQRARIIAGQAVLFGAAGVPMAGVVAPAIADWLGIREMDSKTADLLNQGLIGTTVNSMLGSDLQISNRFALGGAVTELMKDIMTNDDPMFIKAFGPAAGGLGGRMWDAFKELQVLYQADRAGVNELDENDIRLAFGALSKIPSTGRNLWKAWLMTNYNQIVDRRHRVTVRRDFEFWTEMGTAIGFQPSAEARARMLQWNNRDTEEVINELVNVRVGLMHRAVFVHKMEADKLKSLADAMQLLDESMPEYVKQQVRMKVIDRVFGENQESLEERELKKFIETTAADKITEDAILDGKLSFGGTDVPFFRPFSEILNNPQREED